MLAALVILGNAKQIQSAWKMLPPLSVGAQVVTVVLLFTYMDMPERQPQPLRNNNLLTEVGRPNVKLLLSRGYGEYINRALGRTREAGFVSGTPVIDLTGQSPGILYTLRAKSIGQAWIVCGYPGSNKRAIAALEKVGCEELSRSWLLVESNGPRSLSPNILQSFGADLERDYTSVTSWLTAFGAGGYYEPREQELFKPT